MSRINRRDFIAGAGAILTTGAIARPVRSLLSTRDAEPLFVPTAADYVMDGLVAMWDGIENAGWGIHDSTLAKGDWHELMGTGWFLDAKTTPRGEFWGDDFLGQTQVSSGFSATPTALRDLLSSTHTKEIICGACFFYDSTITTSEPLGGTFGGGIPRNSMDCKSPQMRLYLNNVARHYIDKDKSLTFTFRADYDNLGWRYDVINGNSHEAYEGDITGTGAINYMYLQPWMHKLHCVRIYDRILSNEEISYNRYIDKARFGL